MDQQTQKHSLLDPVLAFGCHESKPGGGLDQRTVTTPCNLSDSDFNQHAGHR